MPISMEYLPPEVVVNILSRLPVTSLLHCKLVCRAWRSLSKDPHLVSMRFSCVGENDPSLILHCDYPIQNQLYSLDLSAHDEDNLRLLKSIEFPIREVAFRFGFGSHPITKEYKVLKIVYHRTKPRTVRNPDQIYRPESQVQIFTLGSPAWRSLGKIPYVLYEISSQVLVSGRLHWQTWPQRIGPDRSLISFDLADEQFRVVPKPTC
ncbi:hypothetical protein Patl1_01885 [Pistacia atlantica]|uniref:Uncharacterized protein n=1 Tax=Pistacia atlantica TaxID=434234 RepID=A0ACC1C7K2_9ROSI|nr:hypothetical protein Patl1_01885 [Pistacia atlantica]